MRPALSPEAIRDVNTRYHDVAADHYDAKWGIDFGDVGLHQVSAKVEKALGRRPSRFGRSLEIGSGTGYFTLNLMRAGVIERATCTDISPGMLATLAANARLRSHLRPRNRRARAAADAPGASHRCSPLALAPVSPVRRTRCRALEIVTAGSFRENRLRA